MPDARDENGCLVIVVSPAGTASYVADEAADGLAADLSTRTPRARRASWLKPARPLLRDAFELLRRVFGDDGRVAAWTRRWNCRWIADMGPSGGPVLGPFDDRPAAVEAEVKWLLENVL